MAEPACRKGCFDGHSPLAVHLFVHFGRLTLCVGGLTVVCAFAATDRTTGGGKDDPRGNKADGPDDHEDDPHRGYVEPVTSRGHSPVHDGTRRDREGAEEHSCTSHFLTSIYLDAVALGQMRSATTSFGYL